jgi:tetratricopeptide (TPR) repeat protein
MALGLKMTDRSKPSTPTREFLWRAERALTEQTGRETKLKAEGAQLAISVGPAPDFADSATFIVSMHDVLPLRGVDRWAEHLAVRITGKGPHYAALERHAKRVLKLSEQVQRARDRQEAEQIVRERVSEYDDLFFEALDAVTGHAGAMTLLEPGRVQHLKALGDQAREALRSSYEEQMASGDAHVSGCAAYRLGLLSEDMRRPARAKSAYERAIASTDPDAAPCGAAKLGLLQDAANQKKAAAETYRIAIDSGHQEAAPLAACGLGLLLAETGDIDGALAAYNTAIDSGHQEYAPDAALEQGVLLDQRGDTAGAVKAYRYAMLSNHPDYAPTAALDLGNLLDLKGDEEGAVKAYTYAIKSEHWDLAPKAAVNLGAHYMRTGDADAALSNFQFARASGHPDQAPRAAINVGKLLVEREPLSEANIKEAIKAFQEGAESEDPAVAKMAKTYLEPILQALHR